MRYTQSMIEIVRSMYSDHRAKEIAQLLGVSEVVVYRIAVKHGIKKPKTWRTDPRSGVFQKGVRQSPGTEFKKGQRAHNDLRLGAVPHRLNSIINHCTFSGIALNRCWAQYFI